MIATSIRSAVIAAPWFRTDWAPCMLLDTQLRISAVNAAGAAAVDRPAESLVGQPLFDVFPDNPDEPTGAPVTALNSLERVLSSGRTDWLGYQRYDLPDPHDPAGFVRKIWTVVNSPLCADRGRVVGVVAYGQDITAAATPPQTIIARLSAALQAAGERLRHAFPAASAQELLSVLTHSHRLVLDTTGLPDVERALELARLRLEVRTGRPARPRAPDHDGTL